MEISLLAIGDRTENYTFRLFKAILEANGYQANLVYLNIGRLHSKNKLTSELKEQLVDLVKSSDIIAAYVFTFNYYLAVDITKHLRAKTNAFILWGGPHAIAEPEECAEHADIVCVNEGEETLLEIVKGFEKYGEHFDKSTIPNIVYKVNGEINHNDIKRLTLSLDSLPYQDYSFFRHYYVNNQSNLVPLTFEAFKEANGGEFTYITMISRGCPFKCAFCLNSNSNCIPYYCGRSVDNVIEELKEVRMQFRENLDSIMFYDDDFFALPLDYITELSSKLKERIKVPIKPLNASAANFNEDKLLQLKKAGAKGIIVGIQTISKNGRSVYHNPATKERINKIIKVMLKHPDMETILHIILGNPYENTDDIAENMLFLNSLPKIYHVSPYQLVIYPGTKLYDRVKTDPNHQARAKEGYYLPYYSARRDLYLWNYLVKAYINKKKDFPWLINYMLDKGYYPLLSVFAYYQKSKANIQVIYNAIKNYGMISTFKKINKKLLADFRERK